MAKLKNKTAIACRLSKNAYDMLEEATTLGTMKLSKTAIVERGIKLVVAEIKAMMRKASQ